MDVVDAEAANSNLAPRNIKGVADQPHSVELELLSSKSRVFITVDGTTVSLLQLGCSFLGCFFYQCRSRVCSDGSEEGRGFKPLPKGCPGKL